MNWKHGDLVRDGDEFNKDPHYWCAYCSFAHGTGFKGCVTTAPPLPELSKGLIGRFTPSEPDPLVKVIDRQLEIERKARAWDVLYAATRVDTARRADLNRILAAA